MTYFLSSTIIIFVFFLIEMQYLSLVGLLIGISFDLFVCVNIFLYKYLMKKYRRYASPSCRCARDLRGKLSDYVDNVWDHSVSLV